MSDQQQLLQEEIEALREQNRILNEKILSLSTPRDTPPPPLTPSPLTGILFALFCIALLVLPGFLAPSPKDDHPFLHVIKKPPTPAAPVAGTSSAATAPRPVIPGGAPVPSSHSGGGSGGGGGGSSSSSSSSSFSQLDAKPRTGCCARSLNTSDVRAGTTANVASIFGSDTFVKWNEAAMKASKDVNGKWKHGNDDVRYMLEHVSKEHAARFLEHLHGLGMAAEDINPLVAKNDARGGALVETFAHPGGGTVRSTGASLRYLYHSLLIYQHASDIKNIVEVGGGYGGLALMLDAVFTWKGKALESYRIYDLGGPRLLQMAYLEAVDAGRGLFCWGDSSTSGEDVPAQAECPLSLLTSTYAISEFPDAVSDAYLKALAGRSTHAFFAWNSPRRSPFLPKDYKEFMEDPLTGDNNRLIVYR